MLEVALPALLAIYDGVPAGEGRAALTAVLGELLVAASRGVGGECGGVVDRAVCVLLTAVRGGGEEGVRAGLELGRSGALLSLQQRR